MHKKAQIIKINWAIKIMLRRITRFRFDFHFWNIDIYIYPCNLHQKLNLIINRDKMWMI